MNDNIVHPFYCPCCGQPITPETQVFEHPLRPTPRVYVLLTCRNGACAAYSNTTTADCVGDMLHRFGLVARYDVATGQPK